MQPAATMPAYEALAHDIKLLGVAETFGLMSDDTALFVTALDSMGVRFHGARHENNAIAMAEGFAAATGRIGIAILGRGPATANAMNGALYALRSGSRVLLIFGAPSITNPAPNALGPDTKALDQARLLQAIGMRTFVATDAHAARHALARAVAATERGDPVALLLPMNVQFTQIDGSAVGAPAKPAAAMAPPPPRPAALAAALALLQKSRRPLIVAGLGAHRAGAREVLVQLAEKIGAGLATTLKVKDMFRGHPCDLGIIGSFSHAAGRRVMDQADCVLVFGAGLNQRTTSYGTALPQGAPVIQVDQDRGHIGRWSDADVAVVADVRVAAQALLDALADRPEADKPLHGELMRRALADFDIAAEFEPASTPRTLDPRVLALELDRLLPADRNLVYDIGNFFQIVPYLSVQGPEHLKITTDSSSIGLGFGTALGFARGRPGQATALLIGDGALLMTLGELETAAREDIALIIVLMNDCAYGAELHYLKNRNAPVAKALFLDIDFAPVAQAFGFQAATVRTLEDLRQLAPMLREPQGPIFLDCKINGSIQAPFVLESAEYEKRMASR
ncbi:MAG: hypothetical protein KJZ83_09350 [Burkholderiaceae bacterium]|nr:hypothetical protein [Burkholderiaceae bacterium]